MDPKNIIIQFFYFLTIPFSIIIFILLFLILGIPLLSFRFVLSWIVPLLNKKYTKILSPHAAFYAPNPINTTTTSNIIVALEFSSPLNFPVLFNLYKEQMVYKRRTTQKNIEKQTEGSKCCKEILKIKHESKEICNDSSICQNSCKTCLKHCLKNEDLVYPGFQQHYEYILGFPFFKWDEDFCIEDHINLLKQNEPVCSVEDAFSIAMKHLNTPFPSGKSPWKMLFIEMKEGFVLLFCCSHALADGYAIFHALTGPCDAKVILMQHSKPQSQSSKTSATHFIIRELKGLLSAIWVINKHLFGHFTFYKKRRSNENLLVRKMSSQTKHSLSVEISLKDVKQVSKNKDFGITSILVSSVVAALQKMTSTKGLKGNLDLIMTTYRKDHPPGLTNLVGLIDMDLPLSSEYQLPYIVQKNIKYQKEWIPYRTVTLLATLTGCAPLWLKSILNKMYIYPALLCDIFPGPMELVSLCGFQVEGMYFSFNSTMMFPCCITILSYAGKIRIVTNMDEVVGLNSGKSITQLAKYIENELQGILSYYSNSSNIPSINIQIV